MLVKTINTVVGGSTAEPDLKELLTIMRRMHVAAKASNWEVVDSLDGLRQSFLHTLKACPDISDQRNSVMICEIIDLDQAVLNLASYDMSKVAGAVSTDC